MISEIFYLKKFGLRAADYYEHVHLAQFGSLIGLIYLNSNSLAKHKSSEKTFVILRKEADIEQCESSD